jgi:methionine aminotransferase
VDYSALDDRPEAEFCEWLTQDVGVAAIPLTAFEPEPSAARRCVRFCFAKREATLEMALDRLAKL